MKKDRMKEELSVLDPVTGSWKRNLERRLRSEASSGSNNEQDDRYEPHYVVRWPFETYGDQTWAKQSTATASDSSKSGFGELNVQTLMTPRHARNYFSHEGLRTANSLRLRLTQDVAQAFHIVTVDWEPLFVSITRFACLLCSIPYIQHSSGATVMP